MTSPTDMIVESRRFLVGTQREVAEFFGLTEAAVAYWAKTGMPRLEDEYDLRAIVRWYVPKSKSKGPAQDETEADARRRRLVAQANREERKDREDDGALVPRDEHMAKLQGLAELFRDKLRILPDTIARLFPGVPGAAGLVDVVVERINADLAAMADAPAPQTDAQPAP